jgi:hypothetical protein
MQNFQSSKRRARRPRDLDPGARAKDVVGGSVTDRFDELVEITMLLGALNAGRCQAKSASRLRYPHLSGDARAPKQSRWPK